MLKLKQIPSDAPCGNLQQNILADSVKRPRQTLQIQVAVSAIVAILEIHTQVHLMCVAKNLLCERTEGDVAVVKTPMIIHDVNLGRLALPRHLVILHAHAWQSILIH